MHYHGMWPWDSLGDLSHDPAHDRDKGRAWKALELITDTL